MKTLTMYRYSITGSFGYSCHLNDEEIIHISGAPLPNDPVHIFGHSVKFKSEMQSALSRMPKSAQDNAKERMITNEHNEIVAVLNRMSDSFSLVYQNRMISIVCTETRFVFTEAQRELAFITRAKDKSVPPRLKNSSSYDWEKAFELSVIETLPEALVALIAAFPMLKF